MLKAGGRRPFGMHRVSRHLHLSLLAGGHLEAFGEPCEGLTHTAIFDAFGPMFFFRMFFRHEQIVTFASK